MGTGYFDLVNNVISGGASSLAALENSTEQDQFHADGPSSGRGLGGDTSAAGKTRKMNFPPPQQQVAQRSMLKKEQGMSLPFDLIMEYGSAT